jgi:hypothetical protein
MMRWTPYEEKRALELRQERKTFLEIARLMGRTEYSIESKISELSRRHQGIFPVKAPAQFCWRSKAEGHLKMLFLDGYSNREIAVLMNGPTQGSVSSKIRTMQQLGRLPKKNNGNHQPSFYFGKIDRTTPAHQVCDEIDLLEHNSCRYPIGELTSPDFHFCKKPRRDTLTSYCAEHHTLCWEVRHARRRRFT